MPQQEVKMLLILFTFIFPFQACFIFCIAILGNGSTPLSYPSWKPGEITLGPSSTSIFNWSLNLDCRTQTSQVSPIFLPHYCRSLGLLPSCTWIITDKPKLISHAQLNSLTKPFSTLWQFNIDTSCLF